MQTERLVCAHDILLALVAHDQTFEVPDLRTPASVRFHEVAWVLVRAGAYKNETRAKRPCVRSLVRAPPCHAVQIWVGGKGWDPWEATRTCLPFFF